MNLDLTSYIFQYKSFFVCEVSIALNFLEINIFNHKSENMN